MGVETGLMIALGATAVASAAGTAATNINNRKNVDETNAMSERLAQQNMEWQTAENAKNRAFNAQQADLASQRQYDNLASLFDRSANYYNPTEVVKRLKEAGLNPAAYFSGAGSQMVQGGTPLATQASYNSGLSPVMPNFTAFQRPDPHIASTAAEVMSKLAGAKRDISDSNLLGSQKEALDGTWRATLDKLKADTRTSEIANYFQEIYGHNLNQNAVKEGVNRIALLSEQALLAREQGNTEKTQQALNQITGEMRNMEGSFHGEMAKNVKLQNETFMDKFNAYLENVESSTAKNRAEAQTENDLRDLRGQLLKADADVQRDMLRNNDRLRAKLQGEIEELMWKNLGNSLNPSEIERRKHAITKQLEEDAKSAEFGNTLFGRALRVLGGGASAGSIAALIKYMPK